MSNINLIKKVVSRELYVDLNSSRRTKDIIVAKSIFYHICKDLVPKITFLELAEATGRKSHGSAFSLYNKTKFEMTYNKLLKEQYDRVLLKVKYELSEDEKSNNFNKLEALVIAWAKDKGILDRATTIAQAMKTSEEVNELIKAIDDDDRDEIIDAIGDILVTIIIQSEMQGVSILDCLNSAYNVISKRTGKMINGQFVKDK